MNQATISMHSLVTGNDTDELAPRIEYRSLAHSDASLDARAQRILMLINDSLRNDAEATLADLGVL